MPIFGSLIFVVCILQRAHHSARLLVLGTRAQRKAMKAIIATILQGGFNNVKLVKKVKRTEVAAS